MADHGGAGIPITEEHPHAEVTAQLHESQGQQAIRGGAHRRSGSDGLVHLGVRLGGCGVMLQAALGQGLSLDTLAFGQDGLAAEIGRASCRERV